jgi:hypothetical protein
MNWKGCGRKRSCPNFRYNIGIWLEGFRRTTEALSQDKSLGRDFNPKPPEYGVKMLPALPRSSTKEKWNFHTLLLK